MWTQDHEPAGSAGSTPTTPATTRSSFLRTAPGAPALVCVANFAAVPHEGLRLGLPAAGHWDEVINTDADGYAGSGVGNMGAVQAVDEPWHGQPASATLRLPPLGTLWLRHAPVEATQPGSERAAATASGSKKTSAATSASKKVSASKTASGKASPAKKAPPSKKAPTTA